jgi:hypothetical protein
VSAGDLGGGGQPAGPAQIHPVAPAVAEQQLGAGVAGQPHGGRGGDLRAALQPGETGGGVQVHDHLRGAALDHRPRLLIAVDQSQ